MYIYIRLSTVYRSHVYCFGDAVARYTLHIRVAFQLKDALWWDHHDLVVPCAPRPRRKEVKRRPSLNSYLPLPTSWRHAQGRDHVVPPLRSPLLLLHVA